MNYRVQLHANAVFAVTVDAPDEDAAVDAAVTEAEDWRPCGQCGGWGQEWAVEVSEWDAREPEVEVSQ